MNEHLELLIAAAVFIAVMAWLNLQVRSAWLLKRVTHAAVWLGVAIATTSLVALALLTW